MRFLFCSIVISLLFPSFAFATTNNERTYDGYTLIAPSEGGNGENGKNVIDLIDMNGDVVHSWNLDTEETQFAELQPDGTLVAILGATSRPNPRSGNVNARLVEIDWDGNITWEYQNDHLHHDFAKLPNGNIVGIVREPLEEARESEISEDTSSTVWVDRLIEIDRATKAIVWEWSQQEALDLSKYPYNGSGELFHTNAVAYLPEGNAFNGNESLMISSREQNTVMIIEKQSGDVVWEFSNGLEHQHDPTLLENGNILIFNNRPSVKKSQVLEIDPKTDSVAWTYEASGFFAEKTSGAQRLPNGNTLITEGPSGQIIEVTPEKEIVWEYHVGNGASVFRAYRYGPHDINWPENFLPDTLLPTPSPSLSSHLPLTAAIVTAIIFIGSGIAIFISRRAH